HVSRAHLEHVGVLTDQLDVFGAHHLRDHRQAGFLARLAEDFKRFFTQALEIVGRGARLVGASAEQAGSRFLHGMRGGNELLARLHGTWSRNHDDPVAADAHLADPDDRTVRLYLAADQLERLRNGNDVIDTRSHLQRLDFMAPPATHCRHNGSLRAARYVRLVASFANAVNDVLDLLFGSSFVHVDDHGSGPPLAGKHKSRDSRESRL